MRRVSILKRAPWAGFFIGMMVWGCVTVPSAWCGDAAAPLNVDVAAMARADECFYDIGSLDNYISSTELTDEENQTCIDNGGTPKRNIGYLWGITPTADTIWFGTAANIWPAGLGSMLANLTADRRLSFDRIPGFKTPNMVFELNESHFMDGEYGFFGDYRPPRVFDYNMLSGKLVDRTPDEPLIPLTMGLRSAGNLNGVVILAGPVIRRPGVRGINMFAFDAATKRFLGSKNIQDLTDTQGRVVAEGVSNIRKWLVIKGVLYTTVGTADGGRVLRWRGSVNDPFRFDVVGKLDDQGVGLVYHENRLFIFTWPPSSDPNGFSLDTDPSNVCDVMMTKEEIPEGGLTEGTEFVSVWNVRNYEPDYATAASYGLGDAVSYDGWLYWGTMHVPLVAGFYHLKQYPRDLLTVRDITRALLKTNRQSVIFRGRNFASGNPEIQLVYGDEFIYQYQENARLSRDAWVAVPNNMHVKPLYGASGFGGNKGLFYTWSMAVYNGQLFVGMLDQTFPEDQDSEIVGTVYRVFNELIGMVPSAMEDTIREILVIPGVEPGPSLYRFVDSHSPAIAETTNGFGNEGIYGFRNLVVAGGAMYAATASTYNLHPTGGWALYKLTPGE